MATLAEVGGRLMVTPGTQHSRETLLQTEKEAIREQYLALRGVRYAAAACGVTVAVLGALGLVGNLSGNWLLASFGEGYKTMVPAVGLALLLCGAAIWCLTIPSRAPKVVVRVLALVVVGSAGLRLVEFALRVDWHSSSFFTTPALIPVSPNGSSSALPTALALFLAAIVILLMAKPVTPSVASLLSGMVTVIGGAFLLGYVYGRPLLYADHMIPIALPAAIALTLLGIAMRLTLFAGETSVRRLTAIRRAEDQAELARRATELQAVIDSIADGVIIYARDGSIAQVNPALTDMMQYPEDEQGLPLVERTATIDLRDADGKNVETPGLAALRGEAVRGQTLILRRGTARERTVVADAAPLYDVHGEIIGAVGTMTDVTEMVRAQQQVQEERQRLFSVLNSFPAYLCLLTPEHECVFANDRFTEWFGEGKPGQKCYDLIFGRSEPCEDCHSYDCLQDGQPKVWEWTAPAGSYFEVYDYPFLDTDGSHLVLEVGFDITERKRAQEELRQHRDHLEDLVRQRTHELQESEREYRELIQNANTMIVRWNPAGVIEFVNVYTEQLLGYEPGELIGKPLTTVVPDHLADGRTASELLGNLVANTEALAENENENITKDGRLLWILWANRAIRDEQGNIVAMMSIGIDRTKEHEASKELEAHRRRLRALAAEVAIAAQRERQRLATVLHDEVAQTLGGLKIHLQLLGAQPKTAVVADELGQVTALADQALRETRVVMSDLNPPTLQQFGLIETLRWWAGQVGEMHGLPVTVNAECAAAQLEPDVQITLYQIAKELLQNTLKYAQATQATITVRGGDGRLEIEVADNGIGFDPTLTHPTDEGGFGLLNARERMMYLGGELQIDSAPGDGTRVTIGLPGGCSASTG